MVKVYFFTHDGSGEAVVDGQSGKSLMLAAVKGKVAGSEAACGGSMVCGTCHVYVDEAWLDSLPAPSDAEKEILEFGIDAKPNSRLSCQILLDDSMDGMRVRTPESQR